MDWYFVDADDTAARVGADVKKSSVSCDMERDSNITQLQQQQQETTTKEHSDDDDDDDDDDDITDAATTTTSTTDAGSSVTTTTTTTTTATVAATNTASVTTTATTAVFSAAPTTTNMVNAVFRLLHWVSEDILVRLKNQLLKQLNIFHASVAPLTMHFHTTCLCTLVKTFSFQSTSVWHIRRWCAV